MRIAIIGTGNVGRAIGTRLLGAGHTVCWGSRHPDGEHDAEVPAAVTGADAVILAIPGRSVPSFLEEHGHLLHGALVVDATNHVGQRPPNAAAAIRALPGARYARAFNTLGWENFADPTFGDERADLFFSCAAGDEATVEALIDAVGLRPVLVGIDAEDVVDGLLPLWFALASTRGRHLAFRLLED